MMAIYYYGLKITCFASLLRALIVAEPLRKHLLFLSALYTVIVAFLSYVFLLAPSQAVNWTLWQYWLGLNFLLTYVYLKLLMRFEDGILFWILLAASVFVIFNEYQEPSLTPFWWRVVRG